MPLRGKVTDFGDLIHHEEWIVKGRRLGFAWHIGPVLDTSLTGRPRSSGGTTTATATGRFDVAMDLQADKKVTLSASYTDEVGNPTPTPDGATVTYTVDNPDVVSLTDNGDGTAVAAATGVLGQAVVHGEASFNGQSVAGDLLVVVVPGLAERFEITAGEPEEVTPETATP